VKSEVAAIVAMRESFERDCQCRTKPRVIFTPGASCGTQETRDDRMWIIYLHKKSDLRRSLNLDTPDCIWLGINLLFWGMRY
jgi:hypothetical protein